MVDKAIQELENELLKIDNIHGPVSDVQLQLALSLLNSRIRNRGLSAREILLQGDQVTNEQIHISDQVLAESQISNRTNNHLSSTNSKTPGCSLATAMDCKVRDLVFLMNECNKNKAYDRYVVVSIEGRYAYVKKLTERVDRPVRSRRQPAWMRGGAYDLE